MPDALLRRRRRQGRDQLRGHFRGPGHHRGDRRTFGAQCVVVAIDVKRSAIGFEVYSHGGRRPMGIDASLVGPQTRSASAPGRSCLPSMDRDGNGGGDTTLELLRAVGARTSVPIVASGGVGTTSSTSSRAALAGADATGSPASIFHYGTFSIGEAKAYARGGGRVAATRWAHE